MPLIANWGWMIIEQIPQNQSHHFFLHQKMQILVCALWKSLKIGSTTHVSQNRQTKHKRSLCMDIDDKMVDHASVYLPLTSARKLEKLTLSEKQILILQSWNNVSWNSYKRNNQTEALIHQYNQINWKNNTLLHYVLCISPSWIKQSQYFLHSSLRTSS